MSKHFSNQFVDIQSVSTDPNQINYQNNRISNNTQSSISEVDSFARNSRINQNQKDYQFSPQIMNNRTNLNSTQIDK